MWSKCHLLSTKWRRANTTRWGYYISNYLSIAVSNQARNGRSTRSFINDGLWSTLLSTVVSGDFVIIEMGHNDDGDPTTDTADRATLPGIANNSVVVTTSTGATETVYSFGWYLRKMIVDVRAKKAVPILSGMVNRNYWTGNTLQSEWPFADYAKQVYLFPDIHI
jgi:lysophospholipase L1-like esterase